MRGRKRAKGRESEKRGMGIGVGGVFPFFFSGLGGRVFLGFVKHKHRL